jgi:hypothetical protein
MPDPARVTAFARQGDGSRSFGVTVNGCRILVTAPEGEHERGADLAATIADLGPEAARRAPLLSVPRLLRYSMTERCPIVLSAERYREMADGMLGVCLECHDERECTEPDAEGYKCDACGSMSVVGIELALVAGQIEISASPESSRSGE